MDKIVKFFLLKLAQKHVFLRIPGCYKHGFPNIDGPVTFLLYELKC